MYAEDPARGFLPTGGTVLALREAAGPHVRVDSGLAPGMSVSSSYDPMLAKVIAWGPDRGTALRRLDTALAQTAVLGVTTNTAFLRALLGHPDVGAGRLDTGLIERCLEQLAPAGVPGEVFAAAALARMLALEPPGPGRIPGTSRTAGELVSTRGPGCACAARRSRPRCGSGGVLRRQPRCRSRVPTRCPRRRCQTGKPCSSPTAAGPGVTRTRGSTARQAAACSGSAVTATRGL